MPWLLLLLACRSGPEPADPARVLDALGMDALPRAAAIAPIEGQPLPYPGYTVRPVSLEVFPDLRLSAALWLPDGPGPHPGVLVAHGHFGEGKSAGESQAPAHALAANGYAVLAVDTPGVEEGDLPGRRIHFDEGAHGRALLAAGGSSALAAQLHGLVAGLDYLQARGDVGEVAVIGASGGSVQAFYLLFVDPRPVAAVLASFVPMPREARAGGCACDGLPGWPGPDPALLAATPRPTLWLADSDMPRPEGLPRSATFRAMPGPHGYEEPMVRATLDWLSDRLGGGDALSWPPPHTPSDALRSAEVGAAGLADVLTPRRPPRWTPSPRTDTPWLATCSGAGPRVIVAGGEAADLAALREAGLAPCPVEVPEDEVGVDEGIIRRASAADRYAGALAAAVRRERAVGVYAVRAWGVAAQGAGVPYVLRDPLREPGQVDPARDPAWVHTPGAWWSGERYPDALAVGEAPSPLARALRALAPTP